MDIHVSDIWEDALNVLGCAVATKTGGDDPTCNSGAVFDCPIFSIHAYSWADDDQPWNFKWRDVEISWYKWLGRETTSKATLTDALCLEMLTECLAAVRHE